MDRGRGCRAHRTPANRREGTGTLADTTLMAVLSSPYVAAALGAGVGVGSFAVARAASRLVTPDDAYLGFAKVALIVTFIGTLGYEAFRVSTRHRPARTS